MKFSEKWLRTFVDPVLSSSELADALTMAGVEVENVETTSADQLFSIKPTPNRGDCLSVWGVAREVAAITGNTLMPLPGKAMPAAIEDSIDIKIEEPLACPRYCGRIVRGVNAGATTPDWMINRLDSSGLRSISAIVDVTNYVMLELGQPLHAFDLARLEGGIRVRFARAGEMLTLLNEKTIALDKNLLVIADQQTPLALAGIMGGMHSAVGDQTRDILLESAFFDPLSIAGKSRMLGFSTDSSYRFERGVDFAATAQALERATQLILEICGGEAGQIGEVSAKLPARDPLRLRSPRIKRLLGAAVDNREVAEILRRLGFAHQARGDDEFMVTPPTYRFDLKIEEDLIEEIARIHGYDKIPARRPVAVAKMLPAPETDVAPAQLRTLMATRDYREIVTYSFIDRRWEEDFFANDNPITLLNPIAEDLNVMRSSLIPGLVSCLRLNVSRQQERVRLFEIGRCFRRDGTAYLQPMRLAALAYGGVVTEQWGEPKRMVDFYDIKGDLEALLAPKTARFEPAQHPALHPGRAAEVIIAGVPVGWIGELHPRLRQKYDLPFMPALFELNLEAISVRGLAAYRAISRLPVVRRDIAVEVPVNVTWEAILRELQKHAPATVLEIMPFDIYRGKGIDSDKKSIAFRVLLQDTLRTLTEAEVSAVVATFIKVLEEEFGATLRK